ncbi:uncharacterized protein N7446_005251 [Penicillium canescens]|uniref:uncharacterized protein n=1 Tax=Penicillium canescens TaxID=5083 RepID=UPI0026E04D4D|nr:uncharacterized protein N7446_005229 [Penicillium canescens]XP_058375328.1 uncharacterized protein N7446_005251 [Penicillium canescens]KAJ6068192.1 hypothetical protein N7446_005229 [Penicillium canescens]KAJ6068214.1 hypothetical protein N7446_005251 [Penicillium canescens]
MISKILKKEPTMLPGMLWDLLRPGSAIRTAEEELIKLFREAELCAPPESTFAGAILRAVRACMFKQTEHMKIRLVQSNMVDVDYFFDSKRDTLNIHHDWLHRQYSCTDSGEVAAKDAVVFCDHIIENVLSMLSATVFSTAPIFYRSKMQTVHEMMLPKMQRVLHVKHALRLMPQRVILKQSLPGMLVVSWENSETESFGIYGQQETYLVVLHKEKCIDLSSGLLHVNRGGHAPCGCAQRLIGQGSKLVEFTHLDCSSRYFPMVAENTRPAIYGLPPRPIFPAGDNPNPSAALPVVRMEGLPDWSNKRQKRT